MKLGKNYYAFVKTRKMVEKSFACLLGQLEQEHMTQEQGNMNFECSGWKKGIAECPNKKVCKELLKIIVKRT